MKYYNDISDLPIAIFDKIVKTGKLTLLLLDKKCKVDLEKVWDNINRQLYDEFGSSDKYIDHLRLLNEATILYCDAYLKGEVWKKTMARVKESMAYEMLESVKKDSLSVLAAKLSKFMGFGININKTSVLEFYGYIELANKQ